MVCMRQWRDELSESVFSCNDDVQQTTEAEPGVIYVKTVSIDFTLDTTETAVQLLKFDIGNYYCCGLLLRAIKIDDL